MMADAKRFEILVVDDEPDILKTLTAFLAQGIPGAEVLGAGDAEAALELMQQHDFDLIMSDYRMPGKNGLELLKEARAQRPDSLRILFTAYPDMEVAIKAANEGKVERFFTKPVDPFEVRDTIRDLLREHRRSTLRERAYERALEVWVGPPEEA